jgi:CRP-like cAMP-binding protein
MNNPNFDFLKSKFNVSPETFLILQSLATKKVIKKGNVLVKQGDRTEKVAFLSSGLMRAYSDLESGKEITKNIFTPISFVGAFTAIVKNEPTLLCYEALIDSEVFEVNLKEFLKISKTNIEISNLYNRILEYIFIVYEKKQIEMMTMNATEQYKTLKKQIPNIDNLIPQFQIASYLNITTVQLSRIRKDMHHH